MQNRPATCSHVKCCVVLSVVDNVTLSLLVSRPCIQQYSEKRNNLEILRDGATKLLQLPRYRPHLLVHQASGSDCWITVRNNSVPSAPAPPQPQEGTR
ncbi:hypothetical protein EVAR_92211_1 [Eumeta japonica]|uniref:Uncharacterized protein n=1 Tax=Eumeta variegata TaxID=151549 RepID=A0A4C1TMA1_EUMVA|nr:hypothetical protein EVAR_92211_1 [Eumeta japonica]